MFGCVLRCRTASLFAENSGGQILKPDPIDGHELKNQDLASILIPPTAPAVQLNLIQVART
jgi:hypothetical protein